MRKLILYGVILCVLYAALLRSIANFITRDTPAYMEALKLTDSDTRKPDVALKTRKEFLHR